MPLYKMWPELFNKPHILAGFIAVGVDGDDLLSGFSTWGCGRFSHYGLMGSQRSGLFGSAAAVSDTGSVYA